MKSFSASKINEAIIKVLEEKGINIPTEIQAQAIPQLLEHDGDFVGRSATGTGKTYAFGVPLLNKIDTSEGNIQAVVLVPTRELCEQVGKELIDLGKYISKLKIQAIYGGIPLKGQIHEISNGAQVIVATPGRLMDLVRREVVKLSNLKTIVFDEADEMLLKGFSNDIDSILATANRNYASWFFSATMPDEVHIIIKKYLNKSLKKVGVGEAKKTNQGIEHWAVKLPAEEKLNVLLHFLTRFGNQKGIIFCRTKSGVQKLYKQLSANKFTCGAIHGDLPQGLRNKVMEQYKEGHISLLIATDVASRGVDVQDLGFVIQYHPAGSSDVYMHRSGRTSRVNNNRGVNLTFLFEEEVEKFKTIEKELKLKVNYLPIPSVKDQLVNNAILWGRKIAKEKPISLEKLEENSKQDFKNELKHLSKDELLEKLLATYLRENQK